MKKIILMSMLCVMGIILLSACPTPTKNDDDKNKNNDNTASVDIATLMANIWEDDSKADCVSNTGNVNKQAIAFEAGGVWYAPDFSDIFAGSTCTTVGWPTLLARDKWNPNYKKSTGTYTVSGNTVTTTTPNATMTYSNGMLTVTSGAINGAGVGTVFTKLD